MSEKQNPSVAVGVGGGAAQPADAPAAAPVAPQPSAPVVAAPVAPPKPPELFGGHRGGGKKRADGLVAGSEAAKAADKEKERLRGQARRAEKKVAEKKVAELPPPLPGAGASLPGVDRPVAAVPPGDGPAVAGPAVAAPLGVAPTFVAWTVKMLERPVKLFTRIGDRFRVGLLMKRVRKLALGKEIEAEAEKRFAFKAEAVNDFNAALTNCAVVELNKRSVAGAQHSHWLELAMTGGELVAVTLDQMDWLEQQILAKAERDKQAAVKKN